MSAPRPGPFDSRKCGCTVGKLETYLSIDYCPMHEAAPELLEALKKHLTWYEGGPAGLDIDEKKLIAETRAAIAKARGKPT